MAEQSALFEDPAAPASQSLGVNQALVLQMIREYGRVERDEAGAAIHARQGRHGADERCDYCRSQGRAVLASLAKRGLKNGKPRSSRKHGADAYDPATSGWPAGF